jgi:hypothetical protein
MTLSRDEPKIVASSWSNNKGVRVFEAVPPIGKALASPRGCARVGAPETFIEGDIAA